MLGSNYVTQKLRLSQMLRTGVCSSAFLGYHYQNSAHYLLTFACRNAKTCQPVVERLHAFCNNLAFHPPIPINFGEQILLIGGWSLICTDPFHDPDRLLGCQYVEGKSFRRL